MRAALLTGPETIEIGDIPRPEPGPEDIQVKVNTVAICGTDLHIYNWDAWSQGRVTLPCTLGHEFAGEVVALGEACSHVKVGDGVSGEGHIVCGFCRNCRTGRGHVCEDWKGLGYDIDGCFCEYLAYPEANLWKNDPELPLDQACCQDPLGNAVHAVYAADCAGNDVVVYGLGPIGLLAIGILKAIGTRRIIAVGRRNTYRLERAKEMGAHHVLTASETDPVAAVKELTDGKGADVALEMAGTESAIQSVLKSVCQGGTAVLLGIPNGPVPIDLAKDVVFNAITVKGITGRRIWDTWYRMAGLLKSGNLDIAPVITHHMPFDAYEEGFALMQSGNCGKVVLTL